MRLIRLKPSFSGEHATCTVFPRIIAEGDYSREAIILNITIKGRRLFERGDSSRDGYYSRKYGILHYMSLFLRIKDQINVRREVSRQNNYAELKFNYSLM